MIEENYRGFHIEVMTEGSISNGVIQRDDGGEFILDGLLRVMFSTMNSESPEEALTLAKQAIDASEVQQSSPVTDDVAEH